MTNKTYYYVYRITNIIENKHYYGKRSCKIPPLEDLGVKYYSSSTDDIFLQDQHENPNNYSYKIIRIYNNIKSATNMEIKLHNKFDVGKNNNFYNRAKQQSTGFDRTGISCSEEHKNKLSISMKRHVYSDLEAEIISKKLSDALMGKLKTDEHKENISKCQQGRIRGKYKSGIKMTITQAVLDSRVTGAAKQSANTLGRKIVLRADKRTWAYPGDEDYPSST